MCCGPSEVSHFKEIIISNNQFFDAITTRQSELETLLCVGLDPDPARFPPAVRKDKEPIFTFNKAMIDATSDLA